jgi:hypothetical protein
MKNIFFCSLYCLFVFFSAEIFAQCKVEEREKMIIVAYHSFIAQLSRYVEVKTSDNMDCRIISVDSSDSFQTIKTKIDRLYADFNADFLLLVGDFEHIPAFVIEEGLSDMHYTFRDENSIEPRMIVGRFSAETENDLKTMIDRSIERNKSSGRFVGIASDRESELTHQKDYEQVRYMGEVLLDRGFCSVTELFDGSQSGLDKEGNPVYTDVILALQTGATWLNYAGYGSYEGWNTGGFENRHLDSLVDHVELPIVVSASCLGGHFAGRTCFAEKWLRTSKNGYPTGAMAVIMSSSFADWDATLSAMRMMMQNMPDMDNNCRLGHLYLQGYNYIVNEMRRFKEGCCWILFGDPSLWIYSTTNNVVTEEEKPAVRSAIYPNPATSIVHIVPQGTVILSDICGRRLVEKHFPTQNNTLKLTSFPSGLYFLSIQTNTQEVKIYKLKIEN